LTGEIKNIGKNIALILAVDLLPGTRWSSRFAVRARKILQDRHGILFGTTRVRLLLFKGLQIEQLRVNVYRLGIGITIDRLVIHFNLFRLLSGRRNLRNMGQPVAGNDNAPFPFSPGISHAIRRGETLLQHCFNWCPHRLRGNGIHIQVMRKEQAIDLALSAIRVENRRSKMSLELSELELDLTDASSLPQQRAGISLSGASSRLLFKKDPGSAGERQTGIQAFFPGIRIRHHSLLPVPMEIADLQGNLSMKMAPSSFTAEQSFGGRLNELNFSGRLLWVSGERNSIHTSFQLHPFQALNFIRSFPFSIFPSVPRLRISGRKAACLLKPGSRYGLKRS
jgi:hypothetical protein